MEPIAPPVEKPANGLAGLRYWRQDLVAGLLVSLISLPFSLGIAVASGAPPIAGLVSAIIAGLLLPFLGGSFVTISGPAAGLAPVLLAAMLALGRGDLAAGYPLLLAVIAMAGCVQIALSLLKAARFSAIFPSTVVEAMLASIGLLIIVKQLPALLGVDFHAHEFFAYLGELPEALPHLQPRVLGLGVFCLALIFALAGTGARWTKVVPPQVVAVVAGTVLGRLLGLDGKALIHVPDKPLGHGIVVPNFAGLLADSSLWMTAVGAVVTLTLVDGVESLATASAVDRIDPYRRKSDPNRVLLAMGVSNICSSLAGGLTIIPGGVKSKACIEGGGRTLWANFYNAVFLILFLFVARDAINLIPLSALAAVLIYTGYKLCRPAIWRHMARVGREQLLVFSATVLATLATDLLWGIVAGVLLKLLMHLTLTSPAIQGGALAGRRPACPGPVARLLDPIAALFRDPVQRVESVGGACHVYFGGPLVCFNALAVGRALARLPREVSEVVLHVGERVTLIDHTSCDNLLQFAEDFGREHRAVVRVEGLERMQRASHDPSCLRLSPSALASRRAGFASLARLALELIPPPTPSELALGRMGLVAEGAHAAEPHGHPITSGLAWTVQSLIGGLGALADRIQADLRPGVTLARLGLAPAEPRVLDHPDSFVWWPAPGAAPDRGHASRYDDPRSRPLL